MNINYKLYLVTDRYLLRGKELVETIEEAINGGVSIVQLREKDISSLEFFNVAKVVKEVTDKYNVPLIINDRIDIALAVDAAGVHIGQSDMPCNIARKILPKGKIIGVSVHSVDEAIKAKEEGADYLGCGAVFSTSTKSDVTTLSIDKLKKIKKSVDIPVVAIGGINENNISKLNGVGIDGVAVISAIIVKENPKKSAEEILEKMKR